MGRGIVLKLVRNLSEDELASYEIEIKLVDHSKVNDRQEEEKKEV